MTRVLSFCSDSNLAKTHIYSLNNEVGRHSTRNSSN